MKPLMVIIEALALLGWTLSGNFLTFSLTK